MLRNFSGSCLSLDDANELCRLQMPRRLGPGVDAFDLDGNPSAPLLTVHVNKCFSGSDLDLACHDDSKASTPSLSPYVFAQLCPLPPTSQTSTSASTPVPSQQLPTVHHQHDRVAVASPFQLHPPLAPAAIPPNLASSVSSNSDNAAPEGEQAAVADGHKHSFPLSTFSPPTSPHAQPRGGGSHATWHYPRSSGMQHSTVLVTGGGSFVSFHIVEELLRAGCSVRVLVDRPVENREVVRALTALVPKAANFLMVFDPVHLAHALVDANYVVHTASLPTRHSPDGSSAIRSFNSTSSLSSDGGYSQAKPGRRRHESATSGAITADLHAGNPYVAEVEYLFKTIAGPSGRNVKRVVMLGTAAALPVPASKSAPLSHNDDGRSAKKRKGVSGGVVAAEGLTGMSDYSIPPPIWKDDHLLSLRIDALRHAERLAIKLRLNVVTLHPSVMIGPSRGGEANHAVSVLKRLFTHSVLPSLDQKAEVSLPFAAEMYWSFVDVRDVARATNLTLHNSAIAPGQRFIISAVPEMCLADIGRIIHMYYPASSPPVYSAPHWLTALLMLCNGSKLSTVCNLWGQLGTRRILSNAKSVQELGMAYTPIGGTIADTIAQAARQLASEYGQSASATLVPAPASEAARNAEQQARERKERAKRLRGLAFVASCAATYSLLCAVALLRSFRQKHGVATGL